MRLYKVSDVIADYDLAKSLKKTGQGWLLSPPVIKVESISSFTVAQDQLLQSRVGDNLESLLEDSIAVFESNTTAIAMTRAEYSTHFGAMMPYTYYHQEVIDTLKGNLGSEYDVRTIGGIISGLLVNVSDTAQFSIGDRSIIFLKQYADGNIMVTAGPAGKVRIQ